MALARSVEWLAKAVLAKPQGKANGSSGVQPPSYWTLEIGRIVGEKLEQHESKVREIIRDELRHK